VPDEKNWFTLGAVTIPKDQQRCGSCWAFSTAATLESLAIISGYEKEPVEFSIQQLIDCDSKDNACNGGWMYKAYSFTAENGIMLAKDYPYEAKSSGECKFDSSKAHFKNMGMVQEKSLSNERLKQLVSKQPIAVGILSNQNFRFYKGGILTEEFL
jgi:C1A family cysteine protease